MLAETKCVSPPRVVGIPLVYTPAELESFFDANNKFHEERLRRRWAEKLLQIVLRHQHNISVKQPEDVHQHATLKRLYVAKGRRKSWGFLLLTVSYEYNGMPLKETFRFVRDSGKESLNGHLYPHPGNFRPAK